MVTLALVAGCATEQEKKDKQPAGLRVHIENKAVTAGSAQPITLLRSAPVALNIAPEPILTEANILTATVMDSPGGFVVEVKFDETGGWTLEQFSASNPGRHFALFGQWGEKLKDSRWLAAPLIDHRISNGILIFTPDATREEAQQLVKGLNVSAKKYAKERAQ